MQFVFAILLLASCDSDEVTVSLDESGELNIRLLGPNGEPIPSQDVVLETVSSSLSIGDQIGKISEVPIKAQVQQVSSLQLRVQSNPIAQRTTNEIGVVEFGVFTQGDFFVRFMYASGNDIYSVYQQVQVLPGKKSAIDIALSEYRQTLEVTALDPYSNEVIEPLANHEVVIINYNVYELANDWSYERRKEVATHVGTTDENGKLSVELPVGYYLVVLYDESGNNLNQTYATIERYDATRIFMDPNP